MKKLFGVFVVGAAALSLASCEEKNEVSNGSNNVVTPGGDTVVKEEDLAGLFATTFSGGSIIGEDGIGSGTYSFNLDFGSTYIDETYEYYSLSAKFAMGNTGPIIDFGLSNEYNYGDEYGDSSLDLNVITDLSDIYIGATGSDAFGEYNIMDDLFASYGEYLEGSASDYDYAKFSIDNTASLLAYLFGDLSELFPVEDTETEEGSILDIVSAIDYSISDFMIDEFTTYELVSQNEAYAHINFKPFDIAAYELVYNSLNSISLAVDGEVLDQGEFFEAWTEVSLEFADLAISFELGINPTSGTITQVAFDISSIYEALEINSEFRLEYLYTETGAALSVPTERVVDANPIIEQLKLEMAYEMFADDILNFFEMNGFFDYEFVIAEEYAGVSYEEGLSMDLEYMGYYYDEILGWCEYVDFLNDDLLSSLADEGMTIQDIIDLYGEEVYIPDSMYLLDLDQAFITTDGEGKYFLTLYWADGTDVFYAPVTITADYYDFYVDILISIDSDNFKA